MTRYVFVVGGLIVVGVALLARAGKLPRNHFVGIRLPSTMKSDEAWLAAHEASWHFVLVAGILMTALGIDVASDPDRPPPSWMLLSAVVGPLVAGGVRAHLVARSVSRFSE